MQPQNFFLQTFKLLAMELAFIMWEDQILTNTTMHI